ncbi:endonuclease/exonuclease/phosphatase family protein [Litoribacter alkaliphilus]|uniref:Endonuclease/exonuclease/phosphatase family protein n=1 Tax=Litoribacter ruber TaxID=702568 RepID=A0AAP2CEF2_9BACT|nr:endonuclease/exonuclease/phosphatase family protein [Litoribacter alkaliphilus]MBS9522898.1 endonuclease/exonuclease/phosphatase family protein [Litoribacter alkaliphilus]
MMKTLTTLVLFVTLTISGFSQSLNIASYNIRFDSPTDEGNMWEDRAPHLINLIKFHQMDIIGTQEGMHHQLEKMQAELGFPYIGVGRDKGDEEGEFSAIFYNPDKFELLEEDTFWLSETPDEPSVGWDAQLPRVCTYGKFKHEEFGEFYVFNVHYDHVGQQAREESSKLVMEKIQEINTAEHPVIFMGDMNVTDDNPAYKTVEEAGMLKDTYHLAPFHSIGPKGTFNAFDWDRLPENRIDYIFITNDFEVIRHGTLSDNYGKKYPSDHFPVLTEIKRK